MLPFSTVHHHSPPLTSTGGGGPTVRRGGSGPARMSKSECPCLASNDEPTMAATSRIEPGGRRPPHPGRRRSAEKPMPITIRCHACDTRVSAPDAAAGRRVRVPAVRRGLSVPQQAGAVPGWMAAPPPVRGRHRHRRRRRLGGRRPAARVPIRTPNPTLTLTRRRT